MSNSLDGWTYKYEDRIWKDDKQFAKEIMNEDLESSYNCLKEEKEKE